jgi:hypothetical protein
MKTPCLVVLTAVLSGCATTGATYSSGVGDAFLEHPPFYAGSETRSLDGAAVGFLPVAYQRGASQPALFDPEVTAEVKTLLADMTSYLADIAAGTPLVEGVDVPPEEELRPPDVRFGCMTESGEPDDDCADRGDGALGRGSQPMHLAVGRPSPEWIEWATSLMSDAGVQQVLVITVEVGQFWIRQHGFRGTKEVELGTDHIVPFPWLTSLEGPVVVLQLTGALVGRDGKAIRIGAEGLLARRTSMSVSILGAQTLVTEDELRQLRTERRDELPGRPLVWQAGIRALVEQLTGRKLPAINAQQS